MKISGLVRIAACAIAAAIGTAHANDVIDNEWDTTLARGETYDIAFTTEEGTFMSLDVSPDGQWITFDLLAH